MSVARAADPALHALAARAARPRLRPDHDRRLRPPLALVVRRPARRSGSRSGTTSPSSRRRRTTPCWSPRRCRARAGSPARRSTTRGRCSATPTQRTPPAIRRSSFATRRCSRTARRWRSPGPSCAARWRRSPRRCAHGRRRPATGSCAFLPNLPQTAVAFLACASLGAVWSVCSADMGPLAMLDRFRQIEPKVLIGVRRLSSTAASRTTALPVLRGLSTSCRACAHVGPAGATSTPTADAGSLARPSRAVHDFDALVADDAAVRAGLAAVRPSALDRLFERHHRPAEGDRARPRRGDARRR